MCASVREEMAKGHGRGKDEDADEEEYFRVEVAIQEHGLQIHVSQSFQASVAGDRSPSGIQLTPKGPRS